MKKWKSENDRIDPIYKRQQGKLSDKRDDEQNPFKKLLIHLFSSLAILMFIIIAVVRFNHKIIIRKK